jgi:flagellar biosynthetic protein FliQ
MIDDGAVLLVREMLWTTIRIALPILGAGLVIGLAISIIQSITSIQDQTLTFVPKILAMIVTAALLIPWIVSSLLAFTSEMLALAS